ncbi:MAG TPA: hypothetical protein PK028_00550 [Bacteroidales bacterium]|jgi:hypothetical protein|nr:hypothetical protein [Bacteroidales bacterium]MDI9573651.1 hypothetical protein [Bacteroidota bacterium]OQC62019.1 MAG: hypothetical protein BWX51_00164 [Bacteroidetes bacterium ADurb.Bin012]MBP9511019.1 hypothetical protein [Bacteroidales bacterium]MBP9587719.1 hypothetical protein [Bacteroidales bacterium]
MHIYRFRITSDSIEDFVREIDISPNQTFEDFQRVFLQAAPLSAEEKTYFYKANARWVKQYEIAEQPLLSISKEKEGDDVRLEEHRLKIPYTHISLARFRDFVDDPHQKFIIEYRGPDIYLFFMEMVKILETDSLANYPKCVTQKGEIPVKPIIIPEEIQEKTRKQREERLTITSLNDDIPEEMIEEQMKELMEDEVFGAIMSGKEVPPSSNISRKMTAREIAEEFGPEFADMMSTDADEKFDDEDITDEDIDDEFADDKSGEDFDDDF